MSFAKLVVFDRRLTGAVLPGQIGRSFSEREVAQQTEAAYRRGADEARAVADHQIVELRTDVQRLSDGILKRLAEVEGSMLAQLQGTLPKLAMDIAHRLLAGFEPQPEMIERICRETLELLLPERVGLELVLCPQDSETLNRLNPLWLKNFPGLRVSTDPSLTSGDCLVHSRFGTTDARLATKLTALERGLTGA